MKCQLTTQDPVDPQCPHFGQCGGCKYQHIPYDEQLVQKEEFVRSIFNHPVDAILPCEPHWRYRNKMEFSFSQAKNGQKFLGLMRKRGRVENLDVCELANPWFLEVLKNVREWWEMSNLRAYHPPLNTGSLRTLTLREGIHTGEKMAVLTISGEPLFDLSEQEIEQLKLTIADVDTLILRKQLIAKKTPTRFKERVLSGPGWIHEKMHDAKSEAYLFKIRAASFFQPNTIQAEALYSLALSLVDLQKEDVLFDLYCGTGTLGIFAAKQVKKVVGIELSKEAILDARENIQCNGIENMELIEGDVGKCTLHEQPTTVIVDPPRMGLGADALQLLIDLQPKKILYISCNPFTQFENCQKLEEKGYQIQRLSPVDQFPHTPHIENIAFLQYKS